MILILQLFVFGPLVSVLLFPLQHDPCRNWKQSSLCSQWQLCSTETGTHTPRLRAGLWLRLLAVSLMKNLAPTGIPWKVPAAGRGLVGRRREVLNSSCENHFSLEGKQTGNCSTSLLPQILWNQLCRWVGQHVAGVFQKWIYCLKNKLKSPEHVQGFPVTESVASAWSLVWVLEAESPPQTKEDVERWLAYSLNHNFLFEFRTPWNLHHSGFLGYFINNIVCLSSTN